MAVACSNWFFTTVYNHLSEHDWKKQHKEFHRELKEKHPQKRQLQNESHYFFSWPKNNEFLGESHDRPTMIGVMGEALKIAIVHPTQRCDLPSNPSSPESSSSAPSTPPNSPESPGLRRMEEVD